MKLAYIKFIFAMLIFGTIGLFVRMIPLSSSEIVLARVVIGGAFLFLILLLKRQKLHVKELRTNAKRLICSGVVLGIGWVFLFEAYRYTTVGIATLLYYLAPILVFLLSPIVFKEALSRTKCIGIVLAFMGMVLINNVDMHGSNPNLGILYGMLSALFYAGLMILNKRMKGLDGLELTFVQLMVAAVVMLAYVLFTHQGEWNMPQGSDLWAMLIIGIVHTGIACYLYFSAMQELPAQSVALCAYLDPCSALVFAFIFLQESLSFPQMIGAILILGGALLGQLYNKNYSKRKGA